MRTFVLLACLMLWPAGPLSAAAAPQAGPPPAEPRIRKIGPDTYQIGTVRLDAAARTVRCNGHVNMDRGGPIELLACLTRGKAHESVLTLDVVPMDLQLALLLLDLAPGANPAVRYRPDGPEAGRPPGDRVTILAEWPLPAAEGEEPAARTVRAEKLLLNVQTRQPAPEARWVFLGSRLVGGRFGADVDGSLVTTFHDPLAILELADETANDDTYYEVNAELCPPVGTPVALIIRAPAPETEEGQPPGGDAG